MRVVYSATHRLHDAAHEVELGVPRPIWEVPARAEQIRDALLRDGGFQLAEPTDHGLAPIEAVHDPGLIRFLATAWQDARAVSPAVELIPDTMLHPALRAGMGPGREPRGALGRLGYWTFETATPIVAGTYAAARSAVDVALSAADLLLAGEQFVYGLCRPPGHHAPRSAFGGYCYFNNAAIAADYLVGRTGEPVAVLDLDYHHGNGTQQIFYDRADVLYVSLHADPDRAYPYYTGFAEETGTGPGLGATLNLPLPVGVTDDLYQEALERALDRIAASGSGTAVVSLGFDTHREDPVGDFALTTLGYHEMGRRVAERGWRLLILQEGGYCLPVLGESARQWLRGAAGRGRVP